MAAFDFPPNATNPNPPEIGDLYSPPGSDITYIWTGTVWNASVGSTTAGVSLVEGGDGIDTSPIAGITATGSVAVDSTVVRTTGAQTINGAKTFTDGLYGNTFGGTQSYTTTADGTGTSIGSITGINDTKLTIATTGNAFGAQLVTPDDQYVEVVSDSTAYARFNAADTSFRVGGTLATAPNITLNSNGNIDIANNGSYGTNGGVSLGRLGILNAYRATDTSDAEVLTLDSNVGGSKARKITFTADGGAKFSTLVETGSNTYDNVCFSGYNTQAGGEQAVFFGQSVTPTGIVFGGTQAGSGTTYKFKILANGSAEFANGKISLNAGGSASFNQSVGIGATNVGTISATNLGAARAYELPNADGTLALVSDITGGAIEFVGDIDVVNDTAPTTPKGGIWVNTQAGNADASFTGLNQQYIALNQLIFLTDNNGWVAGGVTDPATYVTIATDQTVSGTKSFTQNITCGNDTFSGVGSVLQSNGKLYLESTDGDNSTAFQVTNPGDYNSPNVNINHDGSAEFASYIIAKDNGIFAQSLDANHGFFAGKKSSTGNIPQDWNAYILGDGSATFAGQVTSGDTTGGANTSGANIGPDGYVSILQSSRAAANCFSIYDTADGSFTCEIKGDGSASFDGFITAGSATQDQSTSIFYNNSANSALYARNYGTGPGLTCEMPSASKALQVNDSNGNVDQAIIYGDGTAAFVGTVTGNAIANTVVQLDAPAFIANAASTAENHAGYYVRQFTAGGYTYAGADPNGTVTFSVKDDGSATFAGNIQAAGLTDGTTTKSMTDVLKPGVPTGAIFSFPTLAAPTGYLECNGAAVSRTTYADLFAIISTNYGAGDGSTTFNVPDLRGEFVRGADNGKGTDSGRAIGTSQGFGTSMSGITIDVSDFGITINDPGHTHSIIGAFSQINGSLPSFNSQSNNQSVATTSSTTGITAELTGGSAAFAGGATETRPRNVALMYMIKT